MRRTAAAWRQIAFGAALSALPLIQFGLHPSVSSLPLVAPGVVVIALAVRVRWIAGASLAPDGVTVHRVWPTSSHTGWQALEGFTIEPVRPLGIYVVAVVRRDGSSARSVCLTTRTRREADALVAELERSADSERRP